MNRERVLTDAKGRRWNWCARDIEPPLPRTDIPAPGENILADAEVRGPHHAARRIHFRSRSEDRNKVAEVLCGGDVTPGTPVSEQYLLDLEREAFKSLCGEKKTQERIQYTLKTGKTLRN